MEDDDCSASQHSDNPEHHEMDHLEDRTGGVKRDNEDEVRSSESANSLNEEEEGKESLVERFRDLHNSVVCLSHQMSIIMKALHVQSCQCELCSTQALFNGHHNGEVAAPLGVEYAQRPGGGKMPMVDRRAVSDYALQHGGVAAVRRFGVPAPVSSYYQRKESHGRLPGNTSPGPSTEADRNGDESVSSGPPSGFNPSVDAMLKMTSSTMATGTPGFLRGRGRGRPKLIGDELDADLVEYMVQLHKNDHNLHRMSATHALEIARAYILEKAPGLLEEQGGHVKLKLTWAMKLVSRIGERQREIELGLPPGTLQNMGRTQQLAEMVAMSKFGGFPPGRLNGGGEGAVAGGGGGGMAPTSLIGAALDAFQQQQASSTPEIMNVRELDLSHISSGVPLDASALEGSTIPTSGALPLIGANGEILFPNEHHE